MNKVKVFFYVVWVFVGMSISVALSLQIPYVQQRLVTYLTAEMSKRLGLEVRIGTIKLAFPLSLYVENIQVRNKQQTFLTLEVFECRLWGWVPHFSSLSIDKMSAQGVSLVLEQQNGVWNFMNDVLEAASKDTTSVAKTFSIQDIDIQNLDVTYRNEGIWMHTKVDLVRTGLILLEGGVFVPQTKLQIDTLEYRLLGVRATQRAKDSFVWSDAYVSQIEKKIIHTIHQVFDNTTYLNLQQTDLAIHHLINETKKQDSISLNHLVFHSDEITKEKYYLRADATLDAMYQNLPLRLQTVLSSSRDQTLIEHLECRVGGSQLSLDAALALSPSASTSEIAIDVHLKQLRLNSKDLAAFHIEEKMPSLEDVELRTNLAFHQHVLTISQLTLLHGVNPLLSIKQAEASRWGRVDSMHWMLQGLDISLDSVELAFAQQIARAHLSDTLTLAYLSAAQPFRFSADMEYASAKARLTSSLRSKPLSCSLDVQMQKRDLDYLIEIQSNVRHCTLPTTLLSTSDLPLQISGSDVKASLTIDVHNKFQYVKGSLRVDSVQIKNQVLTNISTDVSFDGKMLVATLNSKDKRFSFDAEVRTKWSVDSVLHASIMAKASSIDLGMWQPHLLYHGSFEADILSKKNYLFVEASVTKSQLHTKDYDVTLENITCVYDTEKNAQTLRLDFAETGYVEIQGMEYISNLVQFIQTQSPQKLVSALDATRALKDTLAGLPQILEIHCRLDHLNRYQPLFEAYYQNLDNLYADLVFHKDAQTFQLTLDTKHFQNSQLKVSQLRAHISMVFDSLSISISSDTLSFLRRIVLTNPLLDVSWKGDKGMLKVSSDKKFYWLNVLAQLTEKNTYDKGLQLQMINADVGINNTLWVVDSLFSMEWTQSAFYVSHAEMTHETQSVRFQVKDIDHHPQLAIDVRDMDLAPLAYTFLSDAFVKGTLNASILLAPSSPEPYLVQASIRDAILNKDTLGTIDAFVQKKEENMVFHLHTSDGLHPLQISSATQSEQDSGILLKAHIDNLNIGIFSIFLKDVFHHIKGFLSGDIAVYQRGKKILYDGAVDLVDCSLGVVFTQCIYNLKPMHVRFEKNKIYFQDFQFMDTLPYGGTGSGSGYVGLDIQNPTQFSYSFQMQAQKILGYQTKIEDNDLYYGDVYGDLTLWTKGDIHADTVHIALVPNQHTNFYFNAGLNKNENFDDLVTFKQENQNVVLRSANASASTRNLLLTIDMNPPKLEQPYEVGVNLILDKTTDNMMHVSTIPNLHLHYATQTGLSLTGRLDITEGTYDFGFSVPGVKDIKISRQFTIDKAYKNALNWFGDPANGEMNVKMQYLATNVNLISLNGSAATSVSSSSTDGSSNFSNFHIYALLKGNFSNFDMQFDIDFADNTSSLNTNFGIYEQSLKKIKANPSELSRQATYLLVLNSFANSSLNNNTDNAFSTSLGATALTTLSTMALDYLNSLAHIKKESFDLGLNSNVYNTYQTNDNSSLTQNLRSQLGLGLKSTLSPRVVLTSDFNLDFALPSTQVGTSATTSGSGVSNSVQFLPNVNIAYLINQSKVYKLNANIFCKSFYDNVGRGAKYKTGVSLSLNRDFDESPKK